MSASEIINAAVAEIQADRGTFPDNEWTNGYFQGVEGLRAHVAGELAKMEARPHLTRYDLSELAMSSANGLSFVDRLLQILEAESVTGFDAARGQDV